MKLSAKIFVIWTFISNWMDGSLFFRSLTGFMDFLKRLAAGSFIAGWFVGDIPEYSRDTGHGAFFHIINKLLNGLPKPIQPPTAFPQKLADVISGSLVLDTPLKMLSCMPENCSAISRQRKSIIGEFWNVAAWVLFALPPLVLGLIVMAAPVLPTMTLAMLLVPVLFFAFLSRQFIVDNFTIAIILFMVLNLIVGFFSLAPQSSVFIALLSSLFMAATLAVSACCKTKGSVDFMFFVFLLGGLATVVVGLYQHFAGYTLGIWLDQELFAGEGRVFSTFGNPNVYGTYLLLAIPLAAACIVYVKNPFWKLCSLGLTGLLVINLALTLSRGCYLSLALAAGIFVLIIEKRLIVAFIPALIGLFFVLPPAVVNRLLSIVNFQDTSTAFRLNIWQGSLRILRDFWMVGLGQGIDAYNRVYPYYAFAAIVSPHSHNLFIQTFVEMGVVGLVVFIGVLACFFRIMVNFLRRASEFRLKVMAAAFISAVIGFLFQGIFDHVFYNYRVMLIFYLFIGLGMAFARVHKVQENA